MSDNNKITLEELTGRNESGIVNIETNTSPTHDVIAQKAVDELLNPKRLKTISRVKPDQVTNITKLYLFDKTFKTPFAKQLADTILELQISLNGLGRQELVQIAQQRTDIVHQLPPVRKGIFK